MPSDPPATDPRVSDSRHIALSFSARGLLAVGAALVLGWAFVTAASAIFVIAVSFFLALVLDPPVTSLVKRTGMSRGRAATLMVLGLVLAGLLITLALLIPLLREVKELVQSLPQIVADIPASDALDCAARSASSLPLPGCRTRSSRSTRASTSAPTRRTTPQTSPPRCLTRSRRSWDSRATCSRSCSCFSCLSYCMSYCA